MAVTNKDLVHRVEGKATQLEQYWNYRNIQMLKDRSRIRLDKPAKVEGVTKWITNEPKVFYDTAASLLSSYEPRFRMPLTINFDTEEKEKMSKSERFVVGVFRNLNDRQISKGRGYWLRDLCYWILSGWYAIYDRVSEEDGDVKFTADLWDPLNVYPEWDGDELVSCARIYEVDQQTAYSMASGWQAKGGVFDYRMTAASLIKVINYWWIKRNQEGEKTVWNCIIMGGQVIKRPKLQKNLKRIPIIIGTVGCPDRTQPDWQARAGENIISANNDIYDYENEMISLMAQIMKSQAYPNIISKTQTGAPAVETESMQGYATVIPLKLSDQLDIMKTATTPAEANVLLGWSQRQRAKASFPDIVYGNVPVELSGFAIAQLMAAIRYKISPYLVTSEKVISKLMTDILSQYRDGDFSKVTLTTVDRSAKQKGMFFVEEYSGKDVPDSLYIQVSVPLTSSMDRTEQMLYARQALQPPQVLSLETLWDSVLDVQDGEQEYDRIIQDQILQQPVVKLIASIEQLKARIQFYQNKGLVAEAQALNRYVMALEMQLGMRKGIPLTGQEQPGEGARQIGTGVGLPPNLLPPEAANSPDVAAAIRGRGPSGISRRVLTEEERSERKSRGQLVGPDGLPIR